MKWSETSLKGVYLGSPKINVDTRGFFMEGFNLKNLKDHGINFEVKQMNISESVAGTIRGLHISDQEKIVYCLEGTIFDVVVDPALRTEAFLLNYKGSCLFVPRGYGHGFQVMSKSALVVYLVNEFYNPETEAGYFWADPKLNINWPNPAPVVSDKDRQWKLIGDYK